MSSVAWRGDQTSTRESRQERRQLSVRPPGSRETNLEGAPGEHQALEQRKEQLERVA
jgi:hypothetical protein